MHSSKRLKREEPNQSFGAEVVPLRRETAKAEEPAREFLTKRMAKVKAIQERIAAKKKQVGVLSISEQVRPTNAETAQTARQLGMPSSQQFYSLRGVRPVFRPLGADQTAGSPLQVMTFHA